jgi:hypothetical protein
MNLKYALAFMFYWLLAGMFFYFGAAYLTGEVYYNEGNNNLTITANMTAPTPITVNSGGGFDKIVQTFLFAFTGIGLTGAPAWAQILLGFVQSGITVMALVLIFGGS